MGEKYIVCCNRSGEKLIKYNNCEEWIHDARNCGKVLSADSRIVILMTW